MKRPRALFQFTAVALLAAVAAPSSSAQTLADKVPADALLYVGWAGSDTLGNAYDKSHLRAFLDVLNLPALLNNQLNQAQQANPERTAFAREVLSAMVKSPAALYIGPVDLQNQAQPVRVALFSKVGAAQAQLFAARLNNALAARRQPGQPNVGAAAAGDFLLIYVGDASFADSLAAPGPIDRPLAQSEAFKSAIAQLGPRGTQAAATVYCDGRAVVQTLAKFAQQQPPGQIRDLFPVIADGAGLTALEQFAWAGDFDGADWHSTTFLGMRERRTGLLALLDNPALSQESLRLIPQSATSAGAFRFDGARLLADINVTAAKISDQTPKQLDSALHTIYIWSGIDINRELLPAFGSEFVTYAAPDSTGNSLRGFTLVNRLRDTKKADAAVTAIEDFLNLLIAQRDPNTKLQFQTRKLPAPYDSVTAHVMPMENLSPAWAIYKDTFFFSFSLSTLQSALDMAVGNKPSILDNPRFAALRKQLGHENFAAFSFADLQQSAPEAHDLLTRLLTSAQAADPGLQSFSLPPLAAIAPTLSPTMKVSWTDAAGYHAESRGPFPGAGFLTPSTFLLPLLAEQIQQAATRKPAPPSTQGGLP